MLWLDYTINLPAESIGTEKLLDCKADCERHLEEGGLLRWGAQAAPACPNALYEEDTSARGYSYLSAWMGLSAAARMAG